MYIGRHFNFFFDRVFFLMTILTLSCNFEANFVEHDILAQQYTTTISRDYLIDIIDNYPVQFSFFSFLFPFFMSRHALAIIL
jgi:hypothetical protein